MGSAFRKRINTVQIRIALSILDHVSAVAADGKRNLDDRNGRTPDTELIEARRSLRWVLRQLARNEY